MLTGTALLALPHIARAQTLDLKVSLSAPYDGSASPYFNTIEKGLYKAVGLNCTFDTSGGAVESVGRVASGAYDFGICDINVLMDFAAKNPTQTPSCVYMMYYRSPLCAISFTKAGIAKPTDLAGKTLGDAVTDGAYRLFPAFCKTTGLDANSVKWKLVDLRLRETLLLRGEVDAILGFDSTSYFNLLKAGAKPDDVRFLYYSDIGLPLYSNAIIASRKMIDSNPDVVKRFLQATSQGWQATIVDPAAAIAALQKKESLIDPKLELERISWVIHKQVVTDESRKLGMGAVDPVRLASSIQIVKDGFELPAAPPSGLVFNASFLPDMEFRKIMI